MCEVYPSYLNCKLRDFSIVSDRKFSNLRACSGYQCLKLLEVAFRARAWLTGYKGKFLGSSAVRGTYVCIDTTSPNEDTTSPGAKTTSFLDTTRL